MYNGGFMSNYIEKRIQKIIEEINPRTICDYGCGTGDLIFKIRDNNKERNINYIGVDYISLYPEKLRPKNQDNIVFYDKQNSDFNIENICKNSCDIIISTYALHHFKRPVAELQLVEKLLAPNGILIMFDSSFNMDNEDHAMKNITSYSDELLKSFLGKYHRHHYLLDEALDLFKATKLTILEATNYSIGNDESDEDRKNRAQDLYDHIDSCLISKTSELQYPNLIKFMKHIFEVNKEILRSAKVSYSNEFLIVAQNV